VAEPLDAASIRSLLARGFQGGPPPADLLARAGGWSALEAVAPALADDRLLMPVVSLLVRDVAALADEKRDVSEAEPAALAVIEAIFAAPDLFDFTDGLNAVCSSPVLVSLVGRDVSERCVAIAGPPSAVGDTAPNEQVVIRHAVALEAATQLAVHHGTTPHKLLGLFEDVVEPQPVRYARAVTRSVACAYDYWEPGESVAEVIDVLTGAAKPASRRNSDAETLALQSQYGQDVAADATWARANVQVARALRANTPGEMAGKLVDAIGSLDQVVLLDDRADAEVLRAALRLLVVALPSMGTASSGPVDAGEWDLAATEVKALSERAKEFTFDAYGLGHWSGDRKTVVLQGWSRLVRDLEWLRDQLDRDSVYEAAVVLDDLVEIYAERRAYDVVASGTGRVLEVLRPAVASGLAAKAGLVRNLSDHVAHLESQVIAASGTDRETVLSEKVAVASQVLQATLASLEVVAEPPGKGDEQAAKFPPLLTEILPLEVLERLEGLSSESLSELAGTLADSMATRRFSSDLIVSKVRNDMLAAISTCEDFAGDVVPAVTDVLDQLIYFVARRMNTQKSYKPYLYDENSKEKPLQNDLTDWLHAGQLTGFTDIEAQEVAGGRVDIQIKFPGGFQVYLELKADSTRVPMAMKTKYIEQNASYQATSVRVGFLVVLRTKAQKDGALPQHLTDYVTHTTVAVDGSGSVRHVVMLEVPGGRKAPSE
jgi:hypothetical protein